MLNHRHFALPRLFAYWVMLSSTMAIADLTEVDDTQQTLTLKRPAQRIISLAPHITELLFSVSAGRQIVGAVSYSDYPEAAKALPRVGGYTRFDMEQIISLQPDLIIGWHSGNPRSQLAYVQSLNIPLFRSNPTTFLDIAHTLRRFGVLTGHAQAGQRLAQDFLQRVRVLQQRYEARSSVRVFYEVWRQPLLTVNGTHIISRVIALCGGENIYHELPSLTPTVSLESILVRRPEVILTSIAQDQMDEWQTRWQVFPDLPAVQRQLLFNINPDYVQRPTYRLLQGMDVMCQRIDQARL